LSWLRSVFGSDGSPIVQYVVIFAIIFTVLAAIVFLVRRLTGGGGSALQGRGSRSRQPRLGIIDVYELDRARQLILLRRDNVEHLLLVGGPNDVVVERNIQRGQRPLPEAALRAEPAAEPLPDPLAEAGRLPDPPRAITESTPRRAEPAVEMPVVVPAPVPGSHAAPPVRLPLDAALLDGDEPGRDLPVPPPSAPRDPTARPRPPVRPPSPPLPRAQEALRPQESVRPAESKDAERPPATEPVLPAGAGFVLPPLVPPPTETRAVDPSVLSDMARQLQAAIARPSSAVGAPPVVPVPPAPAEKAVDPMAAAMASIEPAVDPVAAAMGERSALPAGAEAPPRPEPPAILPAPPPPPAPMPSPAPMPNAPAPAPRTPVKAGTLPPLPSRSEPATPPAKAEPKSPGNPFSVEEIEAEFARLLGRPLDKRG
jgi:flagellar protein FliO/FliZ